MNQPLQIKPWRLSRFLSQDELAERSEVSKRTIVALESETPPRPHPRTVRKLAAALDTEPGNLFRQPKEED